MTNKERILEIQKRLNALNYKVDEDGKFGPQLHAALMEALDTADIKQPPVVAPPLKPTQLAVSAKGRAAIMNHEGVRLKAYGDPATGGEPWTIGVGHTSAAGPPKVFKGMTLMRHQVEEILAQDLKKFEGYIHDMVKVDLKQHEFDALVSLVFNIGPGNFKNSTVLRELNQGDKQSAADAFLKFKYANGKVMPGLVNRRNDERRMFLGK